MRLAYKELEIDRKMEEKKLGNLEGKKKEQAERLGMGLGARRCTVRPSQPWTLKVPSTLTPASASASSSSSVSHSVLSEMQLIEQETPVGAKASSRSKLDMFDEPGFTSGPPK